MGPVANLYIARNSNELVSRLPFCSLPYQTGTSGVRNLPFGFVQPNIHVSLKVTYVPWRHKGPTVALFSTPPWHFADQMQ